MNICYIAILFVCLFIVVYYGVAVDRVAVVAVVAVVIVVAAADIFSYALLCCLSCRNQSKKAGGDGASLSEVTDDMPPNMAQWQRHILIQ